MVNIVEIVDIDYTGVWAETKDAEELIFISLPKEKIQIAREVLSEKRQMYVFLQKDWEWRKMS
ncbi:hypothetical protein [Bacillus toyonensis]|uniref:hypothetical protein n=1 Tax=Bacillus cereus group TaxID=86661 RepID=UPI000BFBF201|nr:hypothetical protein [Bacillus toyonensis]MDA2638383.1 hypothetical protein [Bacillus cereus]MBU4642289.1 hypothetical protein [Bacillus toyonensis]PGT76755.1 hypothetical protein COD14_08535 [Bacillus cereus]PGV89949.1 hypothetical protein COD86_27065 [Bacillus cereus]HDR7495225.1 hypothetical protein [Bacillus cereus]